MASKQRARGHLAGVIVSIWALAPGPFVSQAASADDRAAFEAAAFLKASNTEANDTFGSCVAVDGDTAVVGAPGEDSNASGVDGDQGNNGSGGSGAAYVFVRTGGVWMQQAYLKASNAEAGDLFGCSVAISGDTIVVGARDEDSNATGSNGDQANNSVVASGAAYVFVRSGGTWTQQAYLKASNPGLGDRFGVSVGVSGDTAIVGAHFEDSNATGVDGDQANNAAGEAGAAFIFVRNAGVWSQQAYLKASNTGADDRFGISVGLSGDTAIVGAFQEDSNATGINGDQGNEMASDSGAAYVFVRNAGVWAQEAYLKASNAGAGDEFGEGVAISGDTALVGADQEDSSGTGVNGNQNNDGAGGSGAAYVFARGAGDVWTQQAYVKASNTEVGDEFGASVALAGERLVIGAFREDSNAIGVNGDQANNDADGSGAAYVFERDNGTWSQAGYLKASNAGAYDRFGIAVAVSGTNLVVGADEEDSAALGINGDQGNNGAMSAGAAYAFDISATGGATTGGGTGGTGAGTGATGGGTGGLCALLPRNEWDVELKRPNPSKQVRFRGGKSGVGTVRGTVSDIELDPRSQVDDIEIALLTEGELSSLATNCATPIPWESADRISKVSKKGSVRFRSKRVGADADLDSGDTFAIWVRAADDLTASSSETNRTEFEVR